MARPRAFDPDTVRERVADVFSAHGFRGTSLSMLEAAAGLGKQSLYNAFGAKQALYLQSLDCAGARMAALQTAMVRAPSGRAALQVFFDGMLQQCADPNPAVHTCIVSAGLLEGIEDPAVAAKLRAKWRATEAVLKAQVERGQRDGSVRKDRPAAELASALMTLMSGLRVSARVSSRIRQASVTAQLMLRTFEPPG